VINQASEEYGQKETASNNHQRELVVGAFGGWVTADADFLVHLTSPA